MTSIHRPWRNNSSPGSMQLRELHSRVHQKKCPRMFIATLSLITWNLETILLCFRRRLHQLGYIDTIQEHIAMTIAACSVWMEFNMICCCANDIVLQRWDAKEYIRYFLIWASHCQRPGWWFYLFIYLLGAGAREDLGRVHMSALDTPGPVLFPDLGGSYKMLFHCGNSSTCAHD